MGQSTDAILFFGYCWDEEIDLFNHLRSDVVTESVEWPQMILRKRGEKNPWDRMPANLDEYLPGEKYEQKEARVKVWTDANRVEIDAWCQKGAAVEKEFEVELHYHCSCDCPMPYLSAMRVVAHRGYPTDIGPLDVDPSWGRKLDRFLQEFGIKKPQHNPVWWLVSHWG